MCNTLPPLADADDADGARSTLAAGAVKWRDIFRASPPSPLPPSPRPLFNPWAVFQPCNIPQHCCGVRPKASHAASRFVLRHDAASAVLRVHSRALELVQPRPWAGSLRRDRRVVCDHLLLRRQVVQSKDPRLQTWRRRLEASRRYFPRHPRWVALRKRNRFKIVSAQSRAHGHLPCCLSPRRPI